VFVLFVFKIAPGADRDFRVRLWVTSAARRNQCLTAFLDKQFTWTTETSNHPVQWVHSTCRLQYDKHHSSLVADRLGGLFRSCLASNQLGYPAASATLPSSAHDAGIPPRTYLLCARATSEYHLTCANRSCIQRKKSRCGKQRNMASGSSPLSFMADQLLVDFRLDLVRLLV
jgi:hypothetical protein